MTMRVNFGRGDKRLEGIKTNTVKRQYTVSVAEKNKPVASFTVTADTVLNALRAAHAQSCRIDESISGETVRNKRYHIVISLDGKTIDSFASFTGTITGAIKSAFEQCCGYRPSERFEPLV